MRFWALPIALTIASMSRTLAIDTAVIVNICLNGLCGNKFGNCSSSSNICSVDCQIQCTPTTSSGGDGDLSSLISRDMFNEMLKHRNDANCPAKGFYTYNAFITAAKSFAGFGTTGDFDARTREIAAFLGQTSLETSGGWASAPDGPYAWGYCYKESQQGYQDTYCGPSSQWPCASRVKYYGRGPFQITYNYNYGPAGQSIGVDLLNYPHLVATDPVISFKTALWFWMTPQSPNPSCHSVITGQWKPSSKDKEAGRVSGYGVITNLINGANECNRGSNQRVIDRIEFYKRYCDILNVSYGSNLDCYKQKAFV